MYIRECRECSKEFHSDSAYTFICSDTCRGIRETKRSKTRVRDNKRRRKDNIKKRYKLTEEEYDSYFVGASCGMCRLSNKRLVLDHCHTTGKIRGVLCSTCNTGIGHLQDSITLLERGIEWLKGATVGD